MLYGATTCDRCSRRPRSGLGRIAVVVLDFYGTLADLDTASRVAAFDDFSTVNQLGIEPGELWKQWKGRPPRGRDKASQLCGDLPFASYRDNWIKNGEAMLAALGHRGLGPAFAQMQAELSSSATLFDDASIGLPLLSERWPLGLLSDADDNFLTAALKRNAIAVDVVLSSEAARRNKPHAELFESMFALLGVDPSEVAYVGDNPFGDIGGAWHAGALPIWLNRRGRSWPHDIRPPAFTVGGLDEVVNVLAGESVRDPS